MTARPAPAPAGPTADPQLARLLSGLDPASPVPPASVRPGLPFVHGRAKATAPTAGLRERFRRLERRRHAHAPRRALPQRRDVVGHLAQSATSPGDAVVGATLGYAWGTCGGRATRPTAAAAVLTHRPFAARTRRFRR